MKPVLKAFDRIFLSIPLTIFLILSLCIISLVGIFPGFRSIFHSHWFLGYLSCIVFMMLYCSLRRWPRLMCLYRYNRKIISDVCSKDKLLSGGKDIFMLRFKDKTEHDAMDHMHRVLSGRGYRKTASWETENGDRKNFYEKSKLNIFTAHLVHLAVAILLLAGIVTGWGGRFFDFSIKEGETIPLEGTQGLLTLEKFSIIPAAAAGQSEEFASRLRINWPDKPVEWRTLKVNSPLRIGKIRLYQQRFKFGVDELRLAVLKDHQAVKVLSIRMNERQSIPELNIAVEVDNFIPDFFMDENHRPATRSYAVQNPAAHLLIYSPADSPAPAEEQWIFRGFMPHAKPGAEAPTLQFALDKVNAQYASGIKYARNPGEFLTYAGLILLVIGSFLTTSRFYRGLILTVKSGVGEATVFAQAMKCKNVFSFEQEIDGILKKIRSCGEVI